MKKYFKKNCYYIFSLFLHVLLCLSFFVSEMPKLNPAQPLAVSIFEKKRNSKKMKDGISQFSSVGKKLNLKSLGVDNSVESLVKQHQEARLHKDEKMPWTMSETYSSNPFTDFQGIEIPEIKRLKNLWIGIDNSIFENPFLSEYNHTGEIHISFDLNQQGELVESSLKACGPDSVLKVLAMRAIRKATQSKTLNFGRETRFYTQFTWADSNSCKKLKGIHQNYLSFCHYAENKKHSFSVGEKSAYYIQALQYGFGALEEIEKYKKEEGRTRTQFDPFQSLKSDPDWSLGC